MKKSSLVLASVGAVLLMAGIYLAFFVAPDAVVRIDDRELVRYSQKIFYFHVPVAETALVFLLLGGFFGAMFLAKRKRSYEQMSYAAVEIGFIFVILVMLTGILWTRADWGVWWEWEPRLTTFLVLTLMYAGYFVLRSSVQEESAKARFGAIFSIIAAVNVPLTFVAGRLESLKPVHPTVFTLQGASMEGPMLAAFLVSMFGMLFFAFSLFIMRLDLLRAREDIEYLKEELEVG
ncbi:MAG: cytochrome c biogenesis protein CcsA [Actinobacteria bacterium]|nr:cytochrome c biogenesis protein CcsA [Actinomycetota bacterium]